MTPKLTPDAALHFAWAICSWILALNAVVFLLYYQLRLLFSFLYVGAADLRLVLFLAPVCVSIGFCCGFLSGGLYELPCVQLLLVWLIFSSLVFMVSVDAAICAQPSLALTSVPSVSVDRCAGFDSYCPGFSYSCSYTGPIPWHACFCSYAGYIPCYV